jgi:hypothetical protein
VSGYIEGGYLVTLVTLSGYALSLLQRERLARQRSSAPEQPKEPGGTPS